MASLLSKGLAPSRTTLRVAAKRWPKAILDRTRPFEKSFHHAFDGGLGALPLQLLVPAKAGIQAF
jgi:hypothetical protein